MAEKDDMDVTEDLPPDEPTQEPPEGIVTSSPKRRGMFAALEKITKKATG